MLVKVYKAEPAKDAARQYSPGYVVGVIWSIGELIEAATIGTTPEPEGRRVGHFRVIDGGRN